MSCHVCRLIVRSPTHQKTRRLGYGRSFQKNAKNSSYEESEIREFERRAMVSDSYILALTAKYKVVLNGQKDGIRTRDYIFLADNLNIVMKYSDIVGAFLVERIIMMVENKNKRINSLTISLVSNKNAQTFVNVSIEEGTELLSILLGKIRRSKQKAAAEPWACGQSNCQLFLDCAGNGTSIVLHVAEMNQDGLLSTRPGVFNFLV